MRHLRGSLKDRLLAQCTRPPTGCWPWLGTISGKGGYGYLQNSLGAAPKTIRAHRAAYELFVGPIPAGLTIDHICGNRLCVNPEHLEPVSNKENILRGCSPSAINAKKTTCKNGHPFSGHNLIVMASERRCRICANRYNRELRAAHASAGR